MTSLLLSVVLCGQLSHDFLGAKQQNTAQARELASTRQELESARKDLATVRDEMKTLRDQLHQSQEAFKVSFQSAQARLEANQAALTELDALKQELENSKKGLDELGALRQALDAAQKELASSKDEVQKLSHELAGLKVRSSESSEKSVENLTEPKTPTQRADGQYELADDSGAKWSNTDPTWLVDWVTAIDLRLKRGPNLVPPVSNTVPPHTAVAPTQYYWQYSPFTTSCPTGNCASYGGFR